MERKYDVFSEGEFHRLRFPEALCQQERHDRKRPDAARAQMA